MQIQEVFAVRQEEWPAVRVVRRIPARRRGRQGTGVPPAAEIRNIVIPSAPKRISLPVPQVPPRESGALQSATGAPPLPSIRHSFPFATNPMERPSGDQNGKYAPSVPDNSTASSLSSERIQRDIFPSLPATKTIRVPSGESAGGRFGTKEQNVYRREATT